jgi:hypothetical protein
MLLLSLLLLIRIVVAFKSKDFLNTDKFSELKNNNTTDGQPIECKNNL